MDIKGHFQIKKGARVSLGHPGPRRTAATYSPNWWVSTIGDGGLNCSVRNGERWNPAAMAAEYIAWRNQQDFAGSTRLRSFCVHYLMLQMHFSTSSVPSPLRRRVRNSRSHVIFPLLEWKSIGGLVRVGFGIAAFTPPAYRRRSLQRPSWEVSSRRRLRA